MQRQKPPYYLKIEFKDTTQYGHLLTISGRNKSIQMVHENYPQHFSADQLKSLIVGKRGNEEFFKNLSRNAAENLLNPRVENALTWNVFQSLNLLNRWDILFDAIDLSTDNKIITQNPGPQKPKVYFWNIMPGTGYFNYHHARLLYNESLSAIGGWYLCEPDCVVFFDNIILLIEAKLKSPFEKCRRKEMGECRGIDTCNLFQHFLSHFKNMGFTSGPHLPEDCERDNQLYRNLRMGHLFALFYKNDVPLIMVNVLNENSSNFSTLRNQSLEFGKKMDLNVNKEFTNFNIITTSWQNIRRSVEEKSDGKNKDLATLHGYLTRHPDLCKK